MRLSDNEFAMLVEMEEFNSYFQRLSPDELVLELLRFESPTSRKAVKAMRQFAAIYSVLSNICANEPLAKLLEIGAGDEAI